MGGNTMRQLVWVNLCRVVAIACLVYSGQASPFGHVGHKMVGDIASKYLAPETAQHVEELLRDDLGADGQASGRTTLGEVASWPDEIRNTRAGLGNKEWHFEDIPICGASSQAQICPNGKCASAQLARLSEILRNPQAPARERNEALKWVVHLIGDIHQPLHAADNKDRGGNSVHVTFLANSTGGSKKTVNLHEIWDVQIVEHIIADRGGDTAFLGRDTSSDEITAWSSGMVADWVKESNTLARQMVYGKLPTKLVCGKPPTRTLAIDETYYDEAGPVIEVQIWKAGVRLASLLNAALGGPSETQVSAEPATSESTSPETATSGPPLYPDRTKTPGHATYHTAENLCAMGSTKDERLVPDAEKKAVYAAYGIDKCQGYCSGPQGCEIDHLISLELGGANTEDNLWPQPYDGDWNAHDKDRLENKLHAMVCKDKSISLEDAQKEISTDWIVAYKKYVGEKKQFNGQPHCK